MTPGSSSASLRHPSPTTLPRLANAALLLALVTAFISACGPSGGGAASLAPEPPVHAALSAASLDQVASGVATFSRGTGGQQSIQLPIEWVGDAAFATWPDLAYGNWNATLELFDASGGLVYRGVDRFLVTPAHPQPTEVKLADDSGVLVPLADRRATLLFWNTLDDQAAVAASRVGVSGSIHGEVNFGAVQHDNGLGDFGNALSHVAFDQLFGGRALSRFAVEFWVDWGNLDRHNYSPFTVQGEATAWGLTSFNFGVAQSPYTPGAMLRDFAVVLQWGPERYLVSVWRAEVAATPYVEHLALNVDLSRAPRDKARLFRDGVDQGPPNWAAVEFSAADTFTPPPYVRIGQSVPETPWVLGCFVDNLKVWSYAKRDYSDRFVE